jgi:hypothetical protein
MALMSCASTTPPAPTNYSLIVKQTADEQRAADCGALHPDPAPQTVVAQLKLVPADPSLRSPDQAALIDWMNHSYAERERRMVYCGVSAPPA